MGTRGPLPKDPEKRVRRNKEHRSTVSARPSGPTRRSMPPGEWLPATRRWWATWCDSAQAEKFTEPAWQRLEMLVVLVDQFWASGNAATMKEIRQNESLLGATPADMQRLKWDIEDREAVKPTAAKDDLAAWRGKRRVVDPAASTGS